MTAKVYQKMIREKEATANIRETKREARMLAIFEKAEKTKLYRAGVVAR
jgi:hypothetical protein